MDVRFDDRAELTSQDLDRLFDDQIDTSVAALAVLESRLTALRLRFIAEADRPP